MKPRAFTMIELLIVFGLISVLAAISVPNFLGAQVRAKVARSHSDMATLVAALEHYHADHHAYPPNLAEDREILRSARLPASPQALAILEPQDRGTVAPRLAMSLGNPYVMRPPEGVFPTALTHLTTPVQYAPPEWGDPFALLRGRPYSYVNWTEVNPRGLWFHAQEPRVPILLVSYGPDSSLTIDFPTNIGAELYDPTNGTTSGGDLYEYPR